MLELQSVSKRLGSLEISDISLSVGDGEYFVLLGPSGVGKTVLLEIIAGLMRPSSGRILWDGTDITSQPPQRRAFAVVYQDYALFPHLTVAGNIAYGLRAAGIGSGRAKDKVHSLTAMFGIAELVERRPATLSAGQQQRVALARALAGEPRLLLLDEPLSALDTNIRLRLRKELKRINRELNTSILHVTHDPEEAMALGDRICVMLNHRVRQTGPPEELFRRPSDPEVAGFLGMRNILPVAEVKEQMCLVCGRQIHANSADSSISHIWIRPEEILLSRKPFDSSARNQFKCTVVEWDHRDSLLEVHVASEEFNLTALITYTSFEQLGIEVGAEVYATFKSSTVHCF